MAKLSRRSKVQRLFPLEIPNWKQLFPNWNQLNFPTHPNVALDNLEVVVLGYDLEVEWTGDLEGLTNRSTYLPDLG